MSAHGPRITDGGYQAPRTDAVPITRGKPIREDTWRIGTAGVTLQIVPLEGGRPDFFEVCLQSNDWVAGHAEYIPCMLRGRELAQQAFALTALELDAGRLPDHIHLPDGAPVGW